MFLRVVCYLVVVWPISASYENCPELSPVGYSIFVAKEVEGQILGTYFCIKGYHLVGEKTFICNASGEWNNPTPTCQYVRTEIQVICSNSQNSLVVSIETERITVGHCPDPVLVNGEPSFSGPVNVSDKVTFKCNENYILQGSNWSQCMNDHTWLPPLPICKSRDCGPPGNPAHGYFEGRDFNSGSTITYYCEDRYHLVGTRDQRCVDGEWSSALPVCELIQEAPKPIPQTKFERVLLAFQETKDLCKAMWNFMKRLKENSLTMEELKYFLEIQKAKLQPKNDALTL